MPDVVEVRCSGQMILQRSDDPPDGCFFFASHALLNAKMCVRVCDIISKSRLHEKLHATPAQQVPKLPQDLINRMAAADSACGVDAEIFANANEFPNFRLGKVGKSKVEVGSWTFRKSKVEVGHFVSQRWKLDSRMLKP